MWQLSQKPITKLAKVGRMEKQQNTYKQIGNKEFHIKKVKPSL
jgi:hypothetical protein